MTQSEILPSREQAPARVLIQTRSLQKSYGSVQVLRGLDLNVREGSVYGFLGRNGAGKTTTIQILMGIQKADRGCIALFAQPAKRPTIPAKRRIGYVSQEQHFYPWMTCNYLGRFVGRFYPTWDAERFEKLLSIFELPPNRKVFNLSQGMRVKLALALALAHRPPLLILDEPTSGLDPAARREFLEIVDYQAQSEGLTTFFSSHIVEEVERIADHVGIIDRGSLCFQGRAKDLLARVRLYRLAKEEDPAVATGLREQLRSDGFQILAEQPRDRALILSAEPALWARLGGGEAMALEDIFLAVTTRRFSAQ